MQVSIEKDVAERAGLAGVVELLRNALRARKEEAVVGGSGGAGGAKEVSTDHPGTIGFEQVDLNVPLHAPWRKAMRLLGFLSPEECRALIDYSERCGYESLAEVYDPSYRSNTRVMVDSDELAALLWERLQLLLPAGASHFVYHKRKRHGRREEEGKEPAPTSSLVACGMNARMRFCRYAEAGDKFNPHRDAHYVDHEGGRTSRWTFMIYLNDVDADAGGATAFLDSELKATVVVQPLAGSVLCFDHDMLHCGAPLARAEPKYLMRTDVMFREGTREELDAARTAAAETPASAAAAEASDGGAAAGVEGASALE